MFIKKTVSILLVFLFLLSLFFLIIAPIEIYKTIDARSWSPVKVQVITHKIIKVGNNYSRQIEVLDLENEKTTSNVSIRYGDISLNLTVFEKLLKSSFYTRNKLYAAGTSVKAFRSPDKSTYVLEQNTIYEMLFLLIVSSIYPIITLFSITYNVGKKNKRGH